jgi:hypothetical protein
VFLAENGNETQKQMFYVLLNGAEYDLSLDDDSLSEVIRVSCTGQNGHAGLSFEDAPFRHALEGGMQNYKSLTNAGVRPVELIDCGNASKTWSRRLRTVLP